jgi:hypothetical protein
MEIWVEVGISLLELERDKYIKTYNYKREAPTNINFSNYIVVIVPDFNQNKRPKYVVENK